MGKRKRKQARKQALQARKRKATWLGRLALIATITACVGLSVTLTLALLGFADGAGWAAAPTGVAIVLAVLFFGMRARTGLHTLSFLGWFGLSCGAIAGGMLMMTAALVFTGRVEAAELVGALTLIPLLLAFGCVLGDHSDGAGDDMATSRTMSHITNIS